MASAQQVKRYLAYWFQLGKKIIVCNGTTALLPEKIITGNRYSQEFEEIWEYIISPDSKDCYLEGTVQTIAELLTPKWDIDPCARCQMPVPMFNVGLPPESCTCQDLPNWPNTELPLPREPVSTLNHLISIRDRLDLLESENDIESG